MSYLIVYFRIEQKNSFVQIIRPLEMYDNFPHWKFFEL